MALALEPVDHCRELIPVDPRTGLGTCRRCGFCGPPVDHVPYSVARAQGHDHERALALAAEVRGRVRLL